jgi:hypothetical protein
VVYVFRAKWADWIKLIFWHGTRLARAALKTAAPDTVRMRNLAIVGRGSLGMRVGRTAVHEFRVPAHSKPALDGSTFQAHFL